MVRARIELDFDYLVDPAESGPGPQSVGIVLALALQAIAETGAATYLRELRFLQPLRFDRSFRCTAAVDRGRGHIDVTSRTLDAAAERAEHFVARIENAEDATPDATPDALEPRKASRLSELPSASDVIAAFRKLDDIDVQSLDLVCGATRYADGIDVELEACSDSEQYQLHPRIIELAWALVRIWKAQTDSTGPAIPKAARAIRVLRPGSSITRLSLRESHHASRSSIRIIAESSAGTVAWIDGLTFDDALAIELDSEAIADANARQRSQRSLPADQLENTIARLVAAALDRAERELPRDTAFRELGLSSLQAIAIAAALSRATDRAVPSTILFDHPTVSRLARALALGSSAQAKPRRLDTRIPQSAEPIAVIGIGCRFPGGADGPDGYWKLLRSGANAICGISSARRDLVPGLERTQRFLAALERIDRFDAPFFGIGEAEARAMDPQHRILLEVVWQALEHAGILPSSLANSRTGVFVGAAPYGYALLLREFDAYSAIGNEPSAAAGRLSYFFDLRGPSLAVDTACSSSLVALGLACDSLRKGETDLCIVAGVNLVLASQVSESLAACGVLSAVGRCAAFDQSADGYVRGEGCGVLILQRMQDADRAPGRVLARILGHAVVHGGRTNGLTASSQEALSEVMSQALERSGIRASDVDFVEAHGAGTLLGDALELGALARTYGSARTHSKPLVVGSVKTNIGHLEPASGIAGLIKAVLAVSNREIPGNLHFDTPSSSVDWEDCNLMVPTQHAAWPHTGVAVAGVSSIGLSGTCAHVLIDGGELPSAVERPEQELQQEQPEQQEVPVLLMLSARSSAALADLGSAYIEYLVAGNSPVDLAATAALHRDPMPERTAVVAYGTPSLVQALKDARTTRVPRTLRDPPKVAFLYSGQGSQYPAMCRELYRREEVFRSAIDECDSLISDQAGWSLVQLLYTDCDARSLEPTSKAQPAVFSTAYAFTRLWESWGVRPACVVGHSLGEYAAAQAAGILSLRDAVRLVLTRSRLMESSASSGMMVAVQAGYDIVQEVIARTGSSASIAAVNSFDQVVISGARRDVESLVLSLERHGLQLTPLSISNGAHSALVDPILDQFEAVVSTVRLMPPSIEIVSSMTGRLSLDEMGSSGYWRRQLRNPVKFADAMRTLGTLGANVFVEIGAHPVLLAGAAKCIDGSHRWVASARNDGADLLHMLRAVAELFEVGVDFNSGALPGIRNGNFARIPSYRFDRESYWIGELRHDSPAPAAEDTDHGRGRGSVAGAESALLQELSSAAVETRLAKLLERLRTELRQLVVAREKLVDLQSSFADLGLDSLGAVQMRSRIQRLLGIVVSPAAFRAESTPVILAQDLLHALGLADDGHAPPELESFASPY